MSISSQPTECPVIDPEANIIAWAPVDPEKDMPSFREQQEIHKDIAVMRALDDHIEEPVEAEEAWAAAEDTSPQYINGFYVFTLVGRCRSCPSALRSNTQDRRCGGGVPFPSSSGMNSLRQEPGIVRLAPVD